MATALIELYTGYQTFLDENIDPVVKHLPLVSNPLLLAGILVLYGFFVSSWGPDLMKDREPFQLRRSMIVYNAIQVVTNGWIVYTAVVHIWMNPAFNWVCQGPDPTGDMHYLVVHLSYLYYLTKIVDLTDTIFMVLRKKDRQISFLHRYHHVMMCLGSWIGLCFIGSGSQLALFGTLNCFVHTVMYSYYLLTILKPEYSSSSFKRRITELQLTQFAIIFFHAVSGFFIPNCTFPKWAIALLIPQDVFMFALFWDFYVKAYLKPAKSTTKKTD
ncbi:elongation of very long chain fatty acids protein [Nesidiocoris tenuis]|uniref:Elongation of very long chain fatty acids protein n=1 Tax=Nesidiocoris tenuis TaxID=355587 RepID=A0ABN7AVK3_9HEMI|nr:elongation of very long chain fatty acids protein [Nesidiocoris tenuis]